MSISLVGHIIAWFHMQGQFKYEWAKSLWWMDDNVSASGSIPRLSGGEWYGLAREAGAFRDDVEDCAAVNSVRGFVTCTKHRKTSTAKDARGRKVVSWKDGKRPVDLDSEPSRVVQHEIQFSSAQLALPQKRSHSSVDSAYMHVDEDTTVYTPSVATRSVASAITYRSRS